jgi:N,N'-diacetyllegionaminate synthase
MEGPDHRASLNPVEFKNMVSSIRNIEKALGNGIKKCNSSEENTKKVARKSIVAKTNIRKGDIITFDNIAYKRPEGGLSPDLADLIIGKKASCNIFIDELITFSNIK